jgi:hypothetical protein
MQMSVDFWFVCVEHRKPRVSSEEGTTVFSCLFLGRWFLWEPLTGLFYRWYYIANVFTGRHQMIGRPWTWPMRRLYGLVGARPCRSGARRHWHLKVPHWPHSNRLVLRYSCARYVVLACCLVRLCTCHSSNSKWHCLVVAPKNWFAGNVMCACAKYFSKSRRL